MTHLSALRVPFSSAAYLLLALSLAQTGCGLEGVGGNSDVDLSGQAGADEPAGADLPTDNPAGEEDADGLVPAGELSCGDRFQGDTGTSQATNRITSYSCSGWDATGPEMTFAYVATAAGQVTASLADLANEQDLDVYVLEDRGNGPDDGNCVGYGDAAASWEAAAGITYYVVIDGYLGSTGLFSLALDCTDSASGGHNPDPPAPGPGNGDEGPAPGTGTCSPSTSIGCADSVTADTTAAAASSSMDSYSCSSWDASGPELVYSFQATEACEATATLGSIATGQDLDVYVMENVGSGCAADQCISFGNLSATWQATAGSTYYIAVDGYYGDAGSFTLELGCGAGSAPVGDDDDDDGPSPGTPEGSPGTLSPSSALSCGSSLNGNTGASGSPSLRNNYGCSSWDASGPEDVYSFVAADTGDVTVSLPWIQPGQDLDLYILEDQGNGTVPNACSSFGDSTVTFSAVAGQTYYIVVDGYNGDAGSYSLELACASATELFVGRTHCLDWNSVFISDPAGITGLLNTVGIDLTDYPILLSATAADANAGTVSMMSAAAQTGSCNQAPGLSTWDLTASQPGSYSNGHFSVGPVDMGIMLGASSLDLYDVTIEGDFSADGSTITNGTLNGELDIDPLGLPWGTCLFALNCHNCPSGSGTCITLSAEQAVLNDNGQGALTAVP